MPAWVRCCVDFDRSRQHARQCDRDQTLGRSRGFRSLIVVTSNYHMPRALAEIAHQLPDVALVPFPVVTDRQRAEPWWTNGATARLMLSEYMKYVYARVRIGLCRRRRRRRGSSTARAPTGLTQVPPVLVLFVRSSFNVLFYLNLSFTDRGAADAADAAPGIIGVARFWARTNLGCCGSAASRSSSAASKKFRRDRCWSPSKHQSLWETFALLPLCAIRPTS